jgi:hypothetical protein
MPAVLSQSNKFVASLALVLAVLAILFAVALRSTPCALAASGSCSVGDNETFASGITVNEDGDDSDTRFEGDTNANLLYLDAGNDRVGIGTASPASLFDVNGALVATTIDGSIGSVTPAAGTFTTLVGTTIDGSIGSVTPNVGTFTTLIGTTIDGPLGSVTPAAVIGTTGVFSRILFVDDDTQSNSTTTGSIHTDGGLGVRKDLQLGGGIKMTNGNSGSGGAELVTTWPSASPADGDRVWRETHNADDSGATSRVVVFVQYLFDDVTATSMDSSISWTVMDNVNAGNGSTVATLSSLGVWTDSSDAATKDYEGDSRTVYGGVDGQVITDKVKQLSVGRYHSSAQPVGKPITERHISPTAQQFWDLFGVGSDPRVVLTNQDGDRINAPGIAPKDLAGVALLAIQELTARIESLEAEIALLTKLVKR